MRILVTGGCGFIGSAVVDALDAAGHDVVVLDRRPAAHAHRGSVTYHCGDVRDPDAVRAALSGVDAVSHQAAKVGLGVDFGDAAGYVDHNDVGTAVLLSALHEARFRGRLVLASSMVVYGEGRYRCAQHEVVRPEPRRPDALEAGQFEPRCPLCGESLHAEAVREDDAVDPRNVYAATKLHQEHLCAIYGREHDAPVIALRYHNVYGPGLPRDTPYAGVAALFRSAIERGEPPLVFEDGGQRRDFVHVTDVARANLLALEAPSEITGPVNIASGAVHTIHDLAVALCEGMGAAVWPTVVGRYRLGDVRHVFASPERARRALGFTAAVGFAEGMAAFGTGEAALDQRTVRNRRDICHTARMVPPTVPVTFERPTRE